MGCEFGFLICCFLCELDDASFLAWTTTPWTLPSNLALVVHPDMKYVKVRETATDKVYIMLESRLSSVFKLSKKEAKKKDAKKPYEVMEEYKVSICWGLFSKSVYFSNRSSSCRARIWSASVTNRCLTILLINWATKLGKWWLILTLPTMLVLVLCTVHQRLVKYVVSYVLSESALPVLCLCVAQFAFFPLFVAQYATFLLFCCSIFVALFLFVWWSICICSMLT